MNTDINKYVQLSKLMKRMKGTKNYQRKKNNSKINKYSMEEDFQIKPPKINITEQEDILKNKALEKQSITDRFENEDKDYINKIPKKKQKR